MSPHAEKLHPLTTLRFFAAAMIVVYHSAGLFGFPQQFHIGIFFDQAVSFFFVLSGFILTYVYPRLDTFRDCRRFWFARFARVWPAHLAGFLFFVCVLGFSTSTSKTVFVTLLNLLLMQAWIPIQKIFFSFNAVSWSISTEVAFYLAFPFLIRNWERTWAIKLLLTLALAIGWALFANHIIPPPSPGSVVNTSAVSFDGFTYINPVARLFEFTLGMSACLLFRTLQPKIRFPALLATCAECAALSLVILAMCNTAHMTNLISRIPSVGLPLSFWSAHGPVAAWAFALLIVTLAFQRGWISRLLSTPPGILLGELSFSIYLLHLTLRAFYQRHSNRFDVYPGWLTYSYFWAILLLLSWLVWAGFERPMRLRILALWGSAQKSPSTKPQTRPSPLFVPTRSTFLIAGLALVALYAPVLLIYTAKTTPPVQHINVAVVESTTPPEFREVHFGNILELIGYQLHSDATGAQLQLTWRTLGKPPSNLQAGIHLVDVAGNIVGQADYVIDPAHLSTPQVPWTDTVAFTPVQLHNIHAFGIALYLPNAAPFLVDRGARDWDNHRLLIPLSPPPATTQSH